MVRYIDLYDDRNCYIGEDGEYQKWNIDPKVIEEAADVVEVVRCKDCKHRPMLENPVGKQYGFNVIAPEDEHGWEDNTCPYLVDDEYYSRYPNDDDFCSCGERREAK